MRKANKGENNDQGSNKSSENSDEIMN